MAVLRRLARVDADAAYAWFTSFEEADLAIQRSLVAQTVERRGPIDLVVERVLDFGEGPMRIRLDIRLRPPRAYDARVHAEEGPFDMTFEFVPRGPACDVVVTVHEARGTPAADPAFAARVLRNVGQNLDDYVPVMEGEVG